MACVQTSNTLRIAIEISCLQKVVYAYVTSSFSTVVALVVSLLRHQNGKICDVSEEETAMRLAEKWKRRLSRERWVQERGAVTSKAKKAHGGLEKWPHPCVRCGSKPCSHPRTFNVHFAILLTLFTLHCTWPTVPKNVPHLLTLMHVLVQTRIACLVHLILQPIKACSTKCPLLPR